MRWVLSLKGAHGASSGRAYSEDCWGAELSLSSVAFPLDPIWIDSGGMGTPKAGSADMLGRYLLSVWAPQETRPSQPAGRGGFPRGVGPGSLLPPAPSAAALACSGASLSADADS